MLEILNSILEAVQVTWTPATVLTAFVAGLAVGYLFLGKLAQNPAYASEYLTSRSTGTLVILTAVCAGGAFYLGQIVATAAEGDGGWPRVVSRYGLWIIYSVALGMGTSFRIDLFLKKKTQRIYAHAKSQIESKD